MELQKSENGWYWLECSYEERMTPKKAGFWWNSKACPRKWSTKEVEKAYLFRDFANDELKKELESTMNSKAEQIASSRATTADIDIARPDGLDYLPFQRAGIAYALDRKSTLIADEMGLGKTIQALGVINATNPKNVLVICPASLRLNWIIEAKKWLVHEYVFFEVQTKGGVPEEANFIVASYERAGNTDLNRDYDLVVVDECHMCKNEKAKRTQRVIGYYDRDSKVEVSGLVDRAKKKLFLTGTPILNRPIEMWPIVHKCDPENFYNFFGFAKRYCGAYNDGYGWNFKGSSNSDELQKKLREFFMVRRLKSEVLKELPSKRRQLVVLPTNGCAKIVKKENDAWSNQEDKLEELQGKADLAWASDDEESYENAVNNLTTATKEAFAEIARIRHEVALAKVPEFIRYAKETIDSVGKVIIFAHHLDVIDEIGEGLKEYFPVFCTGPMKVEDRQVSVDTFQNKNDCQVFIGTIGAAGVGLTLTAASTVIFAELDWMPGRMTQAEDRAHRIGQLNSVNIIHVVLDGSLDQRLASILIAKQEVADSVLDTGADIDLEAKAVVVPVSKRDKIIKPKKVRKYEKKSRDVALMALRGLSSVCDGAVSKDGQGFNGVDTKIGHSLASQHDLSDKQTWLALNIVRKYKGQLEGILGEDFLKLQEAWKTN